jgi:hypothetical protein
MTFSWFLVKSLDISMTAVKFTDISRFSRLVVTVYITMSFQVFAYIFFFKNCDFFWLNPFNFRGGVRPLTRGIALGPPSLNTPLPIWNPGYGPGGVFRIDDVTFWYEGRIYSCTLLQYIVGLNVRTCTASAWVDTKLYASVHLLELVLGCSLRISDRRRRDCFIDKSSFYFLSRKVNKDKLTSMLNWRSRRTDTILQVRRLFIDCISYSWCNCVRNIANRKSTVCTGLTPAGAGVKLYRWL